MIKYLQFKFVYALESLCAIEHFFFHDDQRFPYLSWLWFEKLHLPHCILTNWAIKLDDRWQTGYWQPMSQEEQDKYFESLG